MNMIRAVVLLFLFVGKLTFFFVYCVGGEGWIGLLHILCVTVVPDEPCVVAPHFRGGGGEGPLLFGCLRANKRYWGQSMEYQF